MHNCGHGQPEQMVCMRLNEISSVSVCVPSLGSNNYNEFMRLAGRDECALQSAHENRRGLAPPSDWMGWFARFSHWQSSRIHFL
jgi:hypothetical protein